ncbi:hypothetical protein FOQG_03524 [Fusarium oxysporum f. sp. raphani 54005]|uniref:Uncharacterized protein n=1 Tax=Fusarium oxysporum f. sp. raphani 54005 TaxID=1089458 RepID=X0CQS0_FUSOX|nr:hypothetical protein FOQG_03524 [Fusarium oxysporum f. sp. raphani 54005]
MNADNALVKVFKDMLFQEMAFLSQVIRGTERSPAVEFGGFGGPLRNVPTNRRGTDLRRRRMIMD